jgi:hypothetical protein
MDLVTAVFLIFMGVQVPCGNTDMSPSMELISRSVEQDFYKDGSALTPLVQSRMLSVTFPEKDRQKE